MTTPERDAEYLETFRLQADAIRDLLDRTDLDAVPVANATERTAPTWEARALAAEARLAAVEALCDDGERLHVHVENRMTGECLPSAGDRCDLTAVYRRFAAAIAEAQP